MKRILGVLIALPALAFAACTTESTPSSSSSSGGTDASSASDTGAANDGGTQADTGTTTDSSTSDAATACNALANLGSVVAETAGGGAKPTPAGGALYDGTFVLTKHEVFSPSSPDSNVRRRTIKITGNTIEYVANDNNGADERTAGTLVVNGTDFDFSVTCPATAMVSVPYTLTSTELVMFDKANQNDVFTYTKQ